MKKMAYLFLAGFLLCAYLTPVCGQEERGEEKVLVLRQAKEFRDSTVAVEVYLIDDILEAKITARMMHATKPRIYNAIVVGPKIGRLSSETRTTLTANLEQEEPYPTLSKDKGFINFGKGEKTKDLKGTLTRELVEFRLPKDKIKKGKKYKLWVQIMSMQKGGKYKTFKFDLEDLPELISRD